MEAGFPIRPLLRQGKQKRNRFSLKRLRSGEIRLLSLALQL